MNIRRDIGRGLAVSAVLLLPACASPMSAGPDAVRAEMYAFASEHGASGGVFRAVAASGAEALRGVMDVPAEGGSLHVVEDATLDAGGGLVHADIRVTRGSGGPVEEHLVIDRARGEVRADTPGGVVTWSVPTDAPWAFEPLARTSATPIAAWIGARAAAAGGSVRVIRADQRTSYRTPGEQVAVRHEAGTVVILGDAVADIDGRFVRDVDGLARRDEAPAKLAGSATPAPDVVR